MAPELRAYLNAKIRRGVQAFADLRAQEIEVTLPERRIYALQLGVFDNGESAEGERKRLAAMGVPCVVWQDAQMRLMADAATSRGTLLGETAGQTSFVTEETLTRVDMRLSAGKSDGNDAARLLHLPDEALSRLESGEALADVLADVRVQAQALGRVMQGYAERSKRCVEGARRYAWPRIAGMWMELYRELPLRGSCQRS